MNRKERRLAAKQRPAFSGAVPPSITDLMDEARQKYRQGNGAQAEALCKQVLERVPTHVHSLNLIGIIAQSSGRYQLSLKMFARAIESDPLNAACHYNIGSSYQALSRRDEAVTHFKRAIELGLSEKNVEEFIVRSPVIATCLDWLEKEPLHKAYSFNAAGLEAIAGELFLRCAMETVVVRTRALEAFFSHLRFSLLQFAATNAVAPRSVSKELIYCLSSLAQQCFMNEYVYTQGEEETRLSVWLRNLLLEQLSGTREVEPLTVAAVAAYFPLYRLPDTEKNLKRDWPASLVRLIQQQFHEPLEEIRDRPNIPKLNAIDDRVSMQVMQQYEENPYPRWIIDPHTAPFTEDNAQQGLDGQQFSGEILIAGCGTGLHVSQVAHQYPNARILAIDISVPSLAYARRKIREVGLNNVEFAQADILKLGTIGRSFDRIESVGVLHHLAEPENGWRILLSLLRPGGEMRVGLYSEIGWRSVVAARALITERGYLPNVDDIRKFRQEIFRSDNDGHWKRITSSVDFYSMSGCRDLLFHVMQHSFSIPQISEFLIDHGLSLVSFEAEPDIIQLFQHQFPYAEMTDLKQWHAFELANPVAARFMYVFSVRKEP